MARSTISCCHSLKMIPLSRIMRFARIGQEVWIKQLPDRDPLGEIPGTVKVSTEAEDGIVKKTITFEMSDVSVKRVANIHKYKFSLIVATYVDESGNVRVCGSPDYPLAFDYTISEGVISGKLTGEDTEVDAFIAD